MASTDTPEDVIAALSQQVQRTQISASSSPSADFTTALAVTSPGDERLLRPRVNISQILKCFHVLQDILFLGSWSPNDMLALHSLHHYVAIPHSGRLNCPLTLLRVFCVLAGSHLCTLIKPLCTPAGTHSRSPLLQTRLGSADRGRQRGFPVCP